MALLGRFEKLNIWPRSATGPQYNIQMSWHCAHAILYVRFKDGKQDSFPVWENVYLVEAADSKRAHEKAVEIAALDQGDSQGTFTWNDRPAEWVFAGIRKIVEVSRRGKGNTLTSGDELTFSELLVQDESTLRDLVNGKSAAMEYVE